MIWGALVMGTTWTAALLLLPRSGTFLLVVLAVLLVGWLLCLLMRPRSYLALPICVLVAIAPLVFEPDLIPISFLGREPPRLQLEGAPHYAGPRAVSLPHSRIDPSRRIDGSWASSSGEDSYQVYAELAPIVPSQGEHQGPVMAWAVCQSKSLEEVKDCMAGWKTTHREAMILGPLRCSAVLPVASRGHQHSELDLVRLSSHEVQLPVLPDHHRPRAVRHLRAALSAGARRQPVSFCSWPGW